MLALSDNVKKDNFPKKLAVFTEPNIKVPFP